MSTNEGGHLRPHFMITLSHADREHRALIDKPECARRVASIFRCKSIVVSKESHKHEAGYHFHVTVNALDASHHTLIKRIGKLRARRNMLQLANLSSLYLFMELRRILNLVFGGRLLIGNLSRQPESDRNEGDARTRNCRNLLYIKACRSCRSLSGMRIRGRAGRRKGFSNSKPG